MKINNDKTIQEWQSDIKIMDKPVINIPSELIDKIEAMSRALTGSEWGGYLIGDKLTISDIIITEQEVTSTEWHTIEHPSRNDIIGTVHSHHNMGSFTSGTDLTYICTTYPINIIYSFKDGPKTWFTFTLPDGNKFITEADLNIIPNDNISAWVEAERVKIKPQKMEVTPYRPYSTPKSREYEDIPIDDDYSKEAIIYDYYTYGCDDCAKIEPTTIYYNQYHQYCRGCFSSKNQRADNYQKVKFTKDDIEAYGLAATATPLE